MIYKVFAIRDAKVGFLAPSFELNAAVAQRNFEYAVNNNSSMNFSAKDFDLYSLGSYDTDKGTFELETLPVYVVSASSLIGGRADG